MNKWRNPGGWLCAVALSFVCLLSGCSIDSDDVPDLMSQRLDLVMKASDKVNPDNQKKAAPIEIRVYELKNDAAFTAADWWSLQDNDKAVLADDLLHRDSFILRPGEEKNCAAPSIRKPPRWGSSPDTAIWENRSGGLHIKFLIHRKKLVQPLYAKEKVELDAGIEQSAIVIKERDE